ncbi:MAG: hypothetical protein QT05_C0003G0019 [archaeon GW2011_AR13]|nr:MAG: hypothetical protein QT05_C0003G0019 [archaeon GW2011_AR13]HIG94216.1 hypothetical protein [Nanoarchaeota archaeon]HIH62674.1 hypothetical protein [Nanoarchaeota archaeon]HIJ09881.1 hypothetical protein [Nanoarchaeota archaeon]
MKDETIKDFQSKSLSYHDLSDPAKKLYLNLLKENYENLAIKGIKLDYFKFVELTNLHFNSLRLACEFIIRKLDGQSINGKHLDDLLNHSNLLLENQTQHSFSGYDPYDSTPDYLFKKPDKKKELISYEGLKEAKEVPKENITQNDDKTNQSDTDNEEEKFYAEAQNRKKGMTPGQQRRAKALIKIKR